MDRLNTDIAALLGTINGLVRGFFAALPNLIIAMVVFTIFWFAGRFAKYFIQRSTASHTHANVGVVIGRLAQYAILILGVLIALAVVAPSVKPSNVISILGVGSVAIGFAFKDILQNFVAGILLLWREPFRVGDQIVFEGFEGTVEDVDTRVTRLKTYDGRRVIIPNGEIYTKSFIVNTAFGIRRSQYDVGIGYGDDIGRAMTLMLQTIKAVEGVLPNPAPDVVLVELAGSTINLRARWWTEAMRADVIRTQSRVLQAICEALTKAGVDLPFPTTVVLLHDQTEEIDGDRTRQREGWPAGDTPPRPLRRASKSRQDVSDDQSRPRSKTAERMPATAEDI